MPRKRTLLEPPVMGLRRAMEAHGRLAGELAPELTAAELENATARRQSKSDKARAQKKDARGRFA